MQAPRDIQSQLRSLTIGEGQRPTDDRSAGSRSRKPVFIGIFVAVIAIAAGGYAWRGASGPAGGRYLSGGPVTDAPPLIVTKLTPPPPATPVITATGKIVSDHSVSVVTKVSGQIISLPFEQGDRVTKGQTLATLEDIRYRARRDEAAARLQSAQANLTYREINFERVAALLKIQSAQDIEYADAQRALDEAKASIAAQQAALDFAQKALDDCVVIAPINGVILERNVEVGDFVAAEGGRGANANAQFAVIADMSKLRVEVDISELDIVRIRQNMPCVVTPDAYKDRDYTGYVMWLDPGANYSKATVQVKVRIEKPDAYLRVEGSAQVIFIPKTFGAAAQADEPGIWIPQTALLMDPVTKRVSVFVVHEGKAVRTSVVIARRHSHHALIAEGLTPGQQVVGSDVDRIRDGQRITQTSSR